MNRSGLLVAIALCIAPSAQAGGLFTPDVGSVGLGRGGAWTARASDVVGGLYYNPAGLVQIDGLSLAGGVSLHRTQRSFQRLGGDGGAGLGTWNVGEDGFKIYEEDANGDVVRDSRDEPYPVTRAAPHVRPIPEGGIAFGLKDPDLTVALGLWAPPAPIQRWDPDGPGRYRLIDQELIQGNIALAVAARPLPWFSVGATFQILYMKLTESLRAQADLLAGDEAINPEDPDWDVLASFTATDVKPTFSVGVLFFPLPWLRVGLSFDPPYRFKGRGSASLSGVVGQRSRTLELIGDGPIHVAGRDDDVVVHAGLPGHLRFGLDVAPLPDVLMFGADVHLEIWSGSGDLSADEVAMALQRDDPDDDLPAEPLVDYLYRVGICPLGAGVGVDCGDENNGGAGSSLETYRGQDGDGRVVVPSSYRTTWSVRLGAEVRPVPFLAVRLGWLYEPPAIPEATMTLTMHDGHKHMISGGISVLPGAWRPHARAILELHVTYSHLFYGTRTIGSGVPREGALVLQGLTSNEIDAGTYTASVDQLGLNLAVHFGAVAQRVRDGKEVSDEEG